MKKTMRYIGMAALALVGTVIMGCSENDLADNSPKGKTVTLTTTISLDGSGTRALDADGKKTFAKGDQIAVLYMDSNDKSQKALTAALETTDISSDGKKAKITVTLENPKAGGQLRCIYPAAMLSGDFKPEKSDIDDMNTINYPLLFNQQDGTLATISSKCDLAVFDGTFTSEAELPGSIVLKNRLAIVAFNIQDFDGNDITSTITKLEINQGSAYGYSFDRTAAAGPIYVAMMPTEDAKENITITASDGTTNYEKTAEDITLKANNLYPVTVTMLDILHTPLTLEAAEDGTEITINNENGKTIQYKVNSNDMVSITQTTTITGLNAGDIVQFFSTNSSLYVTSNYITIKPSKKTYVYGNVMSLIDDNRSDPETPNFANDKVIGADNALRCLFSFAANIEFHDTKQLLLPATTLTKGCYENMFGHSGLKSLPENLLPATTLTSDCYNLMFCNCTGLTSLPENLLPAMTLAENCYQHMFSGCTGLKSLPEKLLPATTLAKGCYSYMFGGCSGLTSLPEKLLPATTLAEECYYQMFNSCTGLTSLPENLLPATTLTKGCYKDMFVDCTGLTNLPEKLLPATTLAETCYLLMFYNCTGLTGLPEKLLPATTLANYCYNGMFQGCTGLETLPANLLPATSLADAAGCYSSMFQDCTALTTAPDLPATSLVDGCYCKMFEGCTKLNSVTCLATDIDATYCLTDWLKGAGTAQGCERLVYVDASMTGAEWQLGTSGEDGKRWSVAAIGGGMIIAQ